METDTAEEIEFSQIKIYKEATLDDNGNFCDIYECPVCQYRSRFLKNIQDCRAEHIRQHHEEEAAMGII